MGERLWKIGAGAMLAIAPLLLVLWVLHGLLGSRCTTSARVRAQIAAVGEKVRAYRCDVGSLPGALQSLAAGDLPYGRYANESEFLDGWGRSLHYASDDRQQRFALYSLGRDGLPGGRDEDADIVFEGSLAPLARDAWRDRGSPVETIDCSAYQYTPQESLLMRVQARVYEAEQARRIAQAPVASCR